MVTPWNILRGTKKKSTNTQKDLVCSANLCYNTPMQETTTTANIARIEDLSPADLQDWLDWCDSIQK